MDDNCRRSLELSSSSQSQDIRRQKSLLRFKHDLVRIFFTPDAPIAKYSEEYDNFWTFLPRFEERKGLLAKNRAKNNGRKGIGEEKASLPSVACWDRPLAELLQRVVVDRDQKDHLTEDVLETVREALKTYLVFLDKQQQKRATRLKEFQDSLPIAKQRGSIIETLKDNQIVLVAGDTGCGKSTQVPRYLLEEGYEGLVVTQPRRIAAIALATRVSHELGCELGAVVGYQIRFERKTSKHTKLTFMTEGLLLRLLSAPRPTTPNVADIDASTLTSSTEEGPGHVSKSPSNSASNLHPSADASVPAKADNSSSDDDAVPLAGHQVIILDEVHERHLSCDLLLGLMKCLAAKRPDLRIVLMSATANLQLFSNYFGNCPVIQVPGRLYPVEVQYVPPDRDRDLQTRHRRRANIDPAPYLKVLSLIEQTTPKNERGDVLVFLSGAQEISCIEEALEGREGWTILPLHSALPIKQQDRVFLPAAEGIRKCILSTNIAETSVTIDGVRFVVDSGKVKEMTYDAACRLQRLKEFWCSKASAQQRKGRAGRTGPGRCFRLYSEKQFDEMEDYSLPEIQRVPLHSVVLQLVQLGLADVRQFPFLEAPSMDSLEHSICTLVRQGALTVDESLTAMGTILAQLPVDLSVGKVLLLGCLFRELLEASLTLAAAMSVQNPLTQSSFRDYDIVRRRKDLEDTVGDPLMVTKVYHEWLRLKLEGNESSSAWCRRRGIDEQRLYELTKLRSQFLRILKEAKLYDIPEAELTSSERTRRHGEVRQLRELRKDALQREKQGRKRKLHENDGGSVLDDDDDEDEMLDVKNLDFRLAQNAKALRHMLQKSSELSGSERRVLLWLLASGLYPQVAFSDTHNSYKKDCDQLFHTDSKGFVTLHPNSVLALNPEVLRLDDPDIVSVEGGLSVSSKHQMLAFISLLETTKPYLVGCVRLPTLHFLLMLAGKVHTSPCLKRLVLDSMVELRVIGSSEGCQPSQLLLRVVQARLLFQIVFRRMLEESTSDTNENGLSSETRRLSRRLLKIVGSVLTHFTDIYYTQRRLLPADLKIIFTGDPLLLCGFLHIGSLESPLKEPVASSSPNDSDSGTKDEDDAAIFDCPECHEVHLSFASCATHLEACLLREYGKNASGSAERRSAADNEREQEREQSGSGRKRHAEEKNSDGDYFCERCGRYIEARSTFDVLRHNRERHQ